MGQTIRPMTEEDLDRLELQAAIEGQEEDVAVRQSYDRKLMLTELSEFDHDHMDEIIKDGYGDWFHAKLLRALYELIPDADSTNRAKLRSAFPGSCAAVMAWYNGRIPKE